jgi:hypothetical protein
MFDERISLPDRWLTTKRPIKFAIAAAVAALGWMAQFPAGPVRTLPGYDIALAATAFSVIMLGAEAGFLTLLAAAALDIGGLLAGLYSSPVSGLPAILRFVLFLATGAAICWIRLSLAPVRPAPVAAESPSHNAAGDSLLPICAWCKKLPDSVGDWLTLEEYLQQTLNVRFTHGFCPECASAFEPAVAEKRIHEMADQ